MKRNKARRGKAKRKKRNEGKVRVAIGQLLHVCEGKSLGGGLSAGLVFFPACISPSAIRDTPINRAPRGGSTHSPSFPPTTLNTFLTHSSALELWPLSTTTGR